MAIEPWIREDIVRLAPGFEGASIVPLGEGMDSRAVLVADAFVFRFPKHPEAGRQLDAEVALLPRLAPRLPVAIPRFEFVGRQGGNGLPFVGYRIIRGEPLERPVFDALSEPARHGILGELAAFLHALHAFPIAEARECGVLVNGFRESYSEDTLVSARAEIFPLVEPSVRRFVERLLQEYLDDDENFRYTPTVLHADLSPDHIFVSRETHSLAGIIDWGDLVIGDPDYDLHYLYEDLGADFVEALLPALGEPDRARLFRKLRFFSACNTVHDVLIGLRRRDALQVEESLTLLRALAVTPPDG